MLFHRHVFPAVTIAVLAVGAMVAWAGEPIVYETIVLVGDPVFDDPLATFFSLGVPTVSNNGVVAFEAFTTSGGSGVLEGVFAWYAGTGQMIAQEGQPLAQHPTETYDRFGTPRVDESGRFMFFADYGGSNVSGAVVAGFPGQLRIIAWSGPDSNPDPDYVQRENIGSLGKLLLSRQGRIALDWGQSQVREVWGGDSNGIALLAFPNMPAPRYPPGTTMCCYGFTLLNEAGQAITRASVSGLGSSAIALVGPDGVDIAVGPDLSAPGVAGIIIGVQATASANGAGDIGIKAVYVDEATGEPLEGLWVGPPRALQPIVIEGMVAPGFPDDEFTGFYGPPLVTPSGRAVFGAHTTGSVAGPPGRFWSWDENELELLLREGDPVANIDGATFVRILGDGTLAVNDSDQIAMAGQISVPDGGLVTSILVTDSHQRLFAVAAVGQPFDVASGDVRTVQGLSVYNTGVSGPLTGMNGDDGFGTFFNDLGELAFRLYFTDDTWGIFMASLVPPPPCPWDLTGDGVVNVLDLIELIFSFGPSDDPGDCPADFNEDGFVNVLDLIQLIHNVGPCPGFDECPWDIDGDGEVGSSDLVSVLQNLGPCDDPANCLWDFNGDDVVDGADVLALVVNFGPCP